MEQTDLIIESWLQWITLLLELPLFTTKFISFVAVPSTGQLDTQQIVLVLLEVLKVTKYTCLSKSLNIEDKSTNS